MTPAASPFSSSAPAAFDAAAARPAEPAATLRLAVIGAGPVGLALALLAAERLPQAQVTLFDARPAGHDVSADGRTLALALGSVHLLERLGAWDAGRAQAITEVHVSQQPPSASTADARFGSVLFGAPEVRLHAADEGVALLGAVLGYGALVAPLQAAWEAQVARRPKRLSSRFGTPVAALVDVPGGVEVDAGVVERFDLAVVAEGGVFGGQVHKALTADATRRPLTHDYRQTAWVGRVTLDGGRPGLAVERFTRHGPAALLPLPMSAGGVPEASIVWCVPTDADPVRPLDAAGRLAVLNAVFPPEAGRLVDITPLKAFSLGLSAERTLVRGRRISIGNAAQTLHPVAGQGLNLGLRDAYALVDALARLAGAEAASRRWPETDAAVQSRAESDAARQSRPAIDAALRSVEWQRAPDRWITIAATDFLARSFTWQAPGLAVARGLGLALLNRLPPVKSALARQMMFGRR